MWNVIRFWIFLNALLICGGWLLSGLHALNAVGYLLLLGIGIPAGLWIIRQDAVAAGDWRGLPLRRFRRALPALFLGLLALSFVGAVMWRPEFSDGLTYRTPRVVQWLVQGHWEWIDAVDPRKNNRGVGFEWLTAPLLLLSKDDRLIFLINIASVCLLPGLTFSWLKSSGVSGRVAWPWSWILAGSTGPILQAGSIAADIQGVPFVLASIVFARRAVATGRFSDLAWSAIAMALPSSVKPFNMVFFLPWAIAVAPAWPLLRRRWLATAALVPVVAVCSFLPMAYLNHVHTGTWTGLVKERLTAESPVIGIAGNVWLIGTQNLLPALMPGTARLQQASKELAATEWGKSLDQSFEMRFFEVRDMEVDSCAGLGLAVCLLLLVSAWPRRRTQKPRPSSLNVKLVDGSMWAGFFIYMTKAGAYEASRLVLPFYIPIITPLLRLPSFRSVVRARWWKIAAILVMLYTAVPLVLSRVRPLLPWRTLLTTLAHLQPEKALWTNALTALENRKVRVDYFKQAREAIPPEERTIGLLSSLCREATLWMPFGSRLVLNVLPGDTIEVVRAKGIRYVVLPRGSAPSLSPELLALRDYYEREGVLVKEYVIPATLSNPEERWAIVRID